MCVENIVYVNNGNLRSNILYVLNFLYLMMKNEKLFSVSFGVLVLIGISGTSLDSCWDVKRRCLSVVIVEVSAPVHSSHSFL